MEGTLTSLSAFIQKMGTDIGFLGFMLGQTGYTGDVATTTDASLRGLVWLYSIDLLSNNGWINCFLQIR